MAEGSSGLIRMAFYGREADRNELDLYDAGKSIGGLGRTVSILAHYYQTGKIISQAPSSQARVNIRPPAAGSFLVDLSVNAMGTIIAAPVVLYITYLFNKWLPGGSEADKARLKNLIARVEAQDGKIESLQRALERKEALEGIEGKLDEIARLVRDRETEHDVLQSITSGSFKEIFRPVGRSADVALIYGSARGAYAGTVDEATAALIEKDIPDDRTTTVRARVTAFSTTSKVGTAMSNQLGRGFRFHFGQMGKLGKEDDFSWSQYRQRDIAMTGRFYRFHDGTIKRLEVTAVERISSFDDDDDIA